MESQYLKHLTGRFRSFLHLSEDLYLDLEDEILTFPLWNLSGQLKGIQLYNWKGDKSNFNNCAESKYWTVAKSGPCVWGLEYLDYNLKYLFVCEGVFDCLSLLPYGNAVAMLTNDPKHLKQQLSLLPFETVAVCDSGKAGAKMAKFANHVVTCKEGEDPNSLHTLELKALLGNFATERDLSNLRGVKK